MTAALATIDRATAISERRNVSTQALVFDPETIQNMQRMAEMMAAAKITVPKHLAGSPGDCLAIVIQAAQFQMNPFAVAQKTHLVNGQLGYEAQLVNAVVQNSGAIRGRFHYEYRGEGQAVECRVGAVLAGESDVTWGEWLSAASVVTKNSPLWKTNPRQQLGYLQVKNWARQYTPGAILGVYSVDELETIEPRDMGQVQVVTEPPAASRTESVKAKLKAKTKPAATEPAVSLDTVLHALSTAADQADLRAAAEQAAKLTDPADQASARSAYKARVAELKAAMEQASESPAPDADQAAEIEASLIRAAQTAADDDERAEILDAARELSPDARDRITAAFKSAA